MTRLATLFAAATLLIAPAASAADPFGHFDRIAVEIEAQSHRLLSEVRHYRHTREYGHLVQDARTLAAQARHAHVTAHVGCDLGHLEQDVRILDSTLHHIQRLVDHIDRGVAYGHGHTHGNAGHVHALLHGIEINVHHLQADLRQLRLTQHHGNVHRHPGHGNGNVGQWFPSPRPTINRRIPAGWGNGMSNGPTINRKLPAGWGNGMNQRSAWRSAGHNWGF